MPYRDKNTPEIYLHMGKLHFSSIKLLKAREQINQRFAEKVLAHTKFRVWCPCEPDNVPKFQLTLDLARQESCLKGVASQCGPHGSRCRGNPVRLSSKVQSMLSLITTRRHRDASNSLLHKCNFAEGQGNMYLLLYDEGADKSKTTTAMVSLMCGSLFGFGFIFANFGELNELHRCT